MDVVSGVRKGIGVLGDIGIKAGEAAVIAWQPWLGWPIIKQFWEGLIEHFTDAALKAMQDGSTTVLIPIINTASALAAEEESSKLKALLENEKTKAEDLSNELVEWKKKYAELIRMRIATPG